MSVNSYNDLRFHIGHEIVCVGYGSMLSDDGEPVNVAIECEDCGMVLVDFDRPPETLHIERVQKKNSP